MPGPLFGQPICHLTMLQREVLRAVGRWTQETEGSWMTLPDLYPALRTLWPRLKLAYVPKVVSRLVRLGLLTVHPPHPDISSPNTDKMMRQNPSVNRQRYINRLGFSVSGPECPSIFLLPIRYRYARDTTLTTIADEAQHHAVQAGLRRNYDGAYPTFGWFERRASPRYAMASEVLLRTRFNPPVGVLCLTDAMVEHGIVPGDLLVVETRPSYLGARASFRPGDTILYRRDWADIIRVGKVIEPINRGSQYLLATGWRGETEVIQPPEGEEEVLADGHLLEVIRHYDNQLESLERKHGHQRERAIRSVHDPGIEADFRARIAAFDAVSEEQRAAHKARRLQAIGRGAGGDDLHPPGDPEVGA